MNDNKVVHHFLTLSTSQLSPSSKPSWVLAEQAVIVHFLPSKISPLNSFKIYLFCLLLRQAGVPVLDLACWRR